MYAIRDFPVDNFTRATFRLAELGFLGVAMMRRVTTPLRCGEVSSSGDLDFTCFLGTLFARIDWFMVRSAAGVAWKERNGMGDGRGLWCRDGLMSDGAHIEELRARARSDASIEEDGGK
jgi:hypothetical protein